LSSEHLASLEPHQSVFETGGFDPVPITVSMPAGHIGEAARECCTSRPQRAESAVAPIYSGAALSLFFRDHLERLVDVLER
jgi:hypothetical protein